MRKRRTTLIGVLRKRYHVLNHRCNNPNRQDYFRYGGRGVKNMFKSANEFIGYVMFELGITKLADLRGRWLDRIDNNRGYEPGNVRFVTPKESANNRRNSKHLQLPANEVSTQTAQC